MANVKITELPVAAVLDGTESLPVVQSLTTKKTTVADVRVLTDGSVTNAKVAAGAAIAKSKLAALDVVNADVNAAAAIAETKLALASDAAAGTASRRTLGTGATQAAAGDHAHSGTSGLLAYKQHRAGSDAGIAIPVGASYADVDATNLVVAFTVPASGKVLVRLSGYLESNPANTYYNLRDGSGDIANTAVFMSQAGVSVQKVYTMIVTGLTPAASLTWKWGAKTASGSGAIYTGPTWGAAIMEVWAAP